MKTESKMMLQLMQTKTKVNAKLKIKWYDMQDNNKIKIKYFAKSKGQDDTHVGATSPSLGVCISWWWRLSYELPSTSSLAMAPENLANASTRLRLP
jgi:hypothetical protein